MDLNLKINSFFRVVLLLLGFFVFQSNIVTVFANSVNLGLNPNNPISETYTYDETTSSAWAEVGVSSRVLVDESRVAAKGVTNLIPKGTLANRI
jgi:hypothetical protein